MSRRAGTRGFRTNTPCSPSQRGVEQRGAGPWGKKLANRTLTVAGKELECEVREAVVEAGARKLTSRTCICKDVPGWIVKIQSDATGTWRTTSELVEFRK